MDIRPLPLLGEMTQVDDGSVQQHAKYRGESLVDPSL